MKKMSFYIGGLLLIFSQTIISCNSGNPGMTHNTTMDSTCSGLRFIATVYSQQH
jgi:hypothetical protein